jgi:hypothetical protein
VSRERVRQIEVRAFEKVQKAVKNRVAAIEMPVHQPILATKAVGLISRLVWLAKSFAISPAKLRGFGGDGAHAPSPTERRIPMKLTDTQLVLLSAASQREDGAVVLAPNLKGGAAGKVVGKLLRDGLIEEVSAAASLPAWRRDDDAGPRALRISKRGPCGRRS